AHPHRPAADRGVARRPRAVDPHRAGGAGAGGGGPAAHRSGRGLQLRRGAARRPGHTSSGGAMTEARGPEPEAAAPSGLLVIDKPLRRTSMDVCRIVRARLRTGGAPKRIKVGHGGTLDPLASGVLVILI